MKIQFLFVVLVLSALTSQSVLAANPEHETVIDEGLYKATPAEVKVNTSDWSKLSADEKVSVETALKQSGLVKQTAKISATTDVKSVLPTTHGMAGSAEQNSFLGIEFECIVRAAACTAAEAAALAACVGVGGPPLVTACQAAVSAAYSQCICH